MRTYLMLTITCPDQPGIVERITRIAVAHGANWEESRMARLGGDFAGIVRLGVPVDKASALMTALEGLSGGEMHVAVRRSDEPLPRGDAPVCTLRLTGADHEGIVHEVARYLANRGVNVEELDTAVLPAPMTGSPLFRMEARVRLPAGQSAEALRRSLDEIARRLAVDVEVEE